MRVVALRLHPYAGVNHKKGSQYEIFNQKDLKILVVAQIVRIVGDSKPKVEQPKTENQPKSVALARGTGKSRRRPKRNTYARKDMRARSPEAGGNDYEGKSGAKEKE